MTGVTILEIKKYKKLKGNLYEIELDDFKKYKIYDDIILKYELLIDNRLDKKKLEKIISENNLLDAYYKALKYISVRMRSALEIRNYLKRKSFNDAECNYAIKKLRMEGYIDEKKYVQAYINDAIILTVNGPKKIIDNLNKLGISESLTREYLDSIDSDEWIDRIKRIVDKKIKTNKCSEKMFKNKVTADLLNLGYYYEDIKIIMDDVKIDATDAFLNEADKVYSRLESKYEGTELILRFKSKMFSKGFEADAINDYINKKG